MVLEVVGSKIGTGTDCLFDIFAYDVQLLLT